MLWHINSRVFWDVGGGFPPWWLPGSWPLAYLCDGWLYDTILVVARHRGPSTLPGRVAMWPFLRLDVVRKRCVRTSFTNSWAHVERSPGRWSRKVHLSRTESSRKDCDFTRSLNSLHLHFILLIIHKLLSQLYYGVIAYMTKSQAIKWVLRHND